MHILVIGTGSVGKTLGTRFAESGHRVTYISRDPADDKLTVLLATHPGDANAASYEDIPAGADAALIALPWHVTPETLDPIAGDLAGLVVMDATNPFNKGGSYGVSGSSGAQEIAKVAPGAKVVKAFNTIGTDVMANPTFGDEQADLFICGDDSAAKETVTTLAADIGFRAVDVGELTMASYVEAMAVVWISLARRKHRNLAWKMMQR